MNSYFIVSTGLQLINSVELIFSSANEYFDKNRKILIISTFKKRNRKEVISLLKLYNWDQIIYIPKFCFSDNPSLFSYITILLELLCFRFCYNREKYSTVSGYVNNPLFRYLVFKLKNGSFFLIDDGSSTLNFSNLSPFSTFKSFKNKLVYHILGISYFDIPNCGTFFTAYPEAIRLSNFHIVRNSYSYIMKNCKYSFNNSIYFIGDTHVEKGYLTLDNYIEILNLVKFHFYYLNFFYVARIGESKKKILVIERNFEVITNDYPFEIFLLQSKVLPHSLVTFHSSALYNSNMLFGSLFSYYYIKLPIFTNEVHWTSLKIVWEQFSQFAKCLNFNNFS